MFLFDTFLYFNMKLIIYFFQVNFHPCYNLCIYPQKIVYRYFESQSNTTNDSLSSHLHTNVESGSHFTSVQRNMSQYYLFLSTVNPYICNGSLIIFIMFFSFTSQRVIANNGNPHIFVDMVCSAKRRILGVEEVLKLEWRKEFLQI